jgi:hypothetical protein
MTRFVTVRDFLPPPLMGSGRSLRILPILASTIRLSPSSFRVIDQCVAANLTRGLGSLRGEVILFGEAPLACLKSQELNDNDMVEAMGESNCRVSRY